MAGGPALSTAGRRNIYVGSEISDSLSLLDVVYANQFEGEDFDPNVLEQTEEDFYRGAPPNWLNFHISEQAESDGTRTSLIKRDGYKTLVEQIQQRRKRPGISTVKLFHQPGCGGTTLAMQVLWDLRKTFRSAVLTGSTSDITNVAKEVVHLFTAGNQGPQNTVLLLVNDEQMLENLQDNIMMRIAEQKVVTSNAVVVLLCCVRKDAVLQSDHVVLKKVLSDTEQQKFNEKNGELGRRFKKKCKDFHGFNIMQTNFSQDYIQQACAVIKTIKRINKPKTQLVAVLSLLNTYVPGSYLLESQCLDFLKHGDPFNENPSVKDRMVPFSELIITFQQDIRSPKKVCMAHPLIAQYCTILLADADATRSNTAKNILNRLCRDEVPPFFLGFVKDMLTKREQKNTETKKEEFNNTENEDLKEMFSKLILVIQDIDKKPAQCASVLKVASKTFDQNPFFPQALARFYYIELKDYNQAEMWAKRAMDRDPQNSFVADTLGQIHKKHLKTKKYSAKPEFLQLAKKAIEAFKHEEQLAENELEADMKEDGKMKFSHFFNTAGLFGYLEVCSIVYQQYGNSLLKDLINRGEVERKCVFFKRFLTYSKPNMKKGNPAYRCISEYVRDFLLKDDRQKSTDFMQKLEQQLDDPSTGVCSFLDRGFTESELKPISKWWEEIFPRSSCKSSTALKGKMPLRSTDTPELHLVTLLLSWPTDSEDTCVVDLSELIQHMRRSYENTYEKYFQSRYLRPLFFMGKGQDLNRIVHRNVLEETIQDWGNEKIFQDPKVQAYLLQVKGVVRHYRVYATIGDKEIEVDANLRNSLFITGQVSFYLGFTIRGPVAFGIQKTWGKQKVSEVEIPKPVQMKPDLSAWTDSTTGQHFVDRHQTALIKRVSDTGSILDKLKEKGLISKDNCEAVTKLQTTQDQMRDILKFVTSAGPTGKDALCDILKGMRSMRPLIRELEESG